MNRPLGLFWVAALIMAGVSDGLWNVWGGSGRAHDSRVVDARPFDRNQNRVSDALETKVARLHGQRAQASRLDVLVALDHAPTGADVQAIEAMGGRVKHRWDDLVYALSVDLPWGSDALESLRVLGSHRGVALVEENAIMNPQIYYATRQARARQVWKRYDVLGNPAQRIAIVDIGLDPSHTDLTNSDGSSRVAGWVDTLVGTPRPNDTNGHGTIVAGIIASNGRNIGGAEDRVPRVHSVPVTAWPGEPSGAGFTTSDYLSLTPRPLSFPLDTTAGPGMISARMKWQNKNAAFRNTLTISDDQGNVLARTSGAANGDSPLEIAVPIPIGRVNLRSGAMVKGAYQAAAVTDSADNNTPYWVQVMTPLSSPGDGFNLLSGMAPRVGLVGVKVLDDGGNPAAGFGTAESLLDGFQFLNDNRDALNIVAANASLGFASVSAVIDAAVNNLVGNGIVVVAASGNGRALDPPLPLASPASARRVLAVGAVTSDDRVASYSSFGSVDTGMVKPDVVAPSMSDVGRQMLSLDTNDVDESVNRQAGFDAPFLPRVFTENSPDLFPNDYALTAEGTSFSAPVVTGLVGLLADAMGSEYARDLPTALFLKSVICMTATETNAPAELAPQSRLDRGGKDLSEGYGRINAEAAVELLRERLSIGESLTETLGAQPFDRKALARQVALQTGQSYRFSLEVPADADFDVYLYRFGRDGGNVEHGPFSEGDPIIVSRSTSARTGGTESFTFSPVQSGTYALIVKAVAGAGQFRLTSSQETSTDREAPRVAIALPAGAAQFMPGMMANLQWTASDNQAIASFDLSFSNDDGMSYLIAVAGSLGGSERSYPWLVPAELRTDRGRLRIIAHDAAGNVGVSDPSPQLAISPPAPDLVIASFELSAVQVAAGGMVTADLSVANLGQQPSIRVQNRIVLSSSIALGAPSDRVLMNFNTNPLAPGEVAAFNGRRLDIPAVVTPGNYYVGLALDSQNRIPEVRENNNVRVLPLTITGP